MGRLAAVISSLCLLLSSKLSLASPVGPSLNSGAGAAAAALAGAALIAKVAEDECDDVGVRKEHFPKMLSDI